MISNLLKNTSVQKAAQIIGHREIKFTMASQRHPMPKDEIRNLLEQIEENENS